jgi:hypothetical protein
MKVRDIAIARSGDKGNRATLSVIVRNPEAYPGHYALLARTLSELRMGDLFKGVVQGKVKRYELPALAALHFVMHEALSGGVTRSLALDAHGKSLSSAVLDVEIAQDANPQAGTAPKLQP